MNKPQINSERILKMNTIIGAKVERRELPNNHKKAIGCFEKAIKLGDEEILSRYNIAVIYFNAGQRQEAEKEFKRVLGLPDKPLDKDSYHLKACSHLLTIYMTSREVSKALDICDKILKIDRNRKGAHLTKAEILQYMGKLENSIKEYELAGFK